MLTIEGIGVVGGFGCGLEELEASPQGGQRPQPQEVATGPGSAATVPVLFADDSRLDAYMPRRKQRGLDHFSRLLMLAAWQALEDAELLEAQRDGIGIVVASGYGSTQSTFGFLDSILDGGSELASPTLFASSLHNSAAARVSISLGITGPDLTVSQLDLSVVSALLVARQWLVEKRVERVLLGGVDIYCDVLGYAWSVCHQSSRPGRAPLPLGEGAFILVLSLDDGESPHHGRLREIRMGRGAIEGQEQMTSSILLTAAIGPDVLCHTPRADDISYASVFGCLPVGLGFDVVVATLGLQRDRVFPSPGNVRGEAWDLDGRDFCCLRRDRRDAWGLVHVGR